MEPDRQKAAKQFESGMAAAFDNFFEGLDGIRVRTEIQVVKSYIPGLELYQVGDRWHWSFRHALFSPDKYEEGFNSSAGGIGALCG